MTTPTKEKGRPEERDGKSGEASTNRGNVRLTYRPNDFDPVSFHVPKVGMITVDGRDEMILAEMKQRGIYEAFANLMHSGKTSACWIRTNTEIVLFAFVGVPDQGGFIRYEAPPTDAGLEVLLNLVSIHIKEGSVTVAECEVRHDR